MLRFAGRCRSILPLLNGMRFVCNESVQRLQPRGSRTPWLCTTSTFVVSSGHHKNGGYSARNSSRMAFSARNLASQATPTAEGVLKPSLAKKAQICELSNMLLLEWNDGTVSRYPFVWLRDNCRCRACWHQDTDSRIALTADLNVDIKPNGVILSDDGSKVDIYWPDNHLSPFDTSLLHDVRFEDDLPKKNIRMWGSELLDHLPTFQFNEIMRDDTKLLNFLEDLRDVGLTLLKDVPAETGHVAKLVDRVSFLKITSLGYFYTVKSKAGANNLAYTGHKLGLHTDLAQCLSPPGMLTFHCIQQSKTGGESIFADGFKTALQLKEEDPEAFEILCNTHCDFMDKGVEMPLGEYYNKSAWPIFSFDRHGNLSEVHFNNPVRDTRLRMPVEKVYPFYKAITTYNDIIHREENTVIYRMQPGDLLMFDNSRVLHGRNAFEVTEDSVRHLEGAFLDWDGVYSKIRCLRERLGMPFHDY